MSSTTQQPKQRRKPLPVITPRRLRCPHCGMVGAAIDRSIPQGDGTVMQHRKCMRVVDGLVVGCQKTFWVVVE